ncbi:unnamed protein product, partial [Prunus brigantina]
ITIHKVRINYVRQKRMAFVNGQSWHGPFNPFRKRSLSCIITSVVSHCEAKHTWNRICTCV